MSLPRGLSSVGRWKLVDVLGSGGMGVVYRGRDQDGGEAAIKVLMAPLASDQMVRRFEREALARIDHPNVVRVLESGANPDGTLYIALELLDGEDLQSRIERGQVSPEEAVSIGAQIASALDAVHRTGIVHRDVKPGNVFLCSDGTAKLLDFGIALAASADTRVTRMGTILGTPSYLSPEQARGESEVDARSDVWSLGAVLYHALAGRPPFERDTALATIVAVLVDDLVGLVRARPGLPRGLSAVVERALEKEPSARFQGAGELERALRTADLKPPALTLDATMEVQPESLGEIRVVSVVLFEGVTDSSRLAEVIGGHGGVLVPLVGGHAIGIFGGEVSEGNEPGRAMRAAIVARRAAARVAVATGRAARSRGGIVGEAVRRAEAACSLERAGVVVDDPTRRSVSAEYRFESIADGVFEIVALPSRDTMVDPATPLLEGPPTMGRDAEIAQMRAAIDHALDACATCVLCVGQPGIGKSRLRREMGLLIAACGEPFRVLTERAEPGPSATTLAVAAAIVSDQRYSPEAPIEERRETLLSLCEEAIGDPVLALECAEALGEAIGTPFPESPRLSAARADPQIMADRRRLAFGDFVEALCESQPVAFLLEDIQWADALSLELLDEILDRLSDRRLVVFATARPELLDTRPNLFAGREVVRMEPRGLRQADVARLASFVAKRALPEAWCRVLTERTAGNPFFVEQIVLDLVEHGDLDAEVDDVPLPLTVEAAVQSRLDHLRPGEKDLCKRASVFGRAFWEEGLLALGVEEARRPLQALQRRDIVASRARSRLAGLREYHFRSAVVSEVGYRMLPEDLRVELHGAAAGFLEAHDDASPEEVALHLERADKQAEAAERYAKAALGAAARGETDVLLRCSERALELGVGEGGLFDLHLARADAFYHLGRPEEQGRHLAAAVESARSDGDRARALSAQAHRLSRAGQTEKAVEAAQAAVDAARTAADADVLALALADKAVMLVLAGRTGEASEVVHESEAVSAEGTTVLTGARVAWARATVGALSGDLGASRDAYERALSLWAKAGDARRMATAEANLADCYNRIGLYEEAEAALRAALESCRRVRNRKTEGYILANLGHGLSASGRHDEALASLAEAENLANEIEDALLLAMIGTYRAVALLGRGSAADAKRVADETATMATARGLQGYAAMAFAVAASACLAMGDVAGALERSTEGLRLRDDLGGVEENEADIFLVHADALARSGRLEEAEATVRRGRERLKELATRIGDPVWRDRFLRGPATHRRLLGDAAAS